MVMQDDAFQSHNGAIAATDKRDFLQWLAQVFQSHNGAIAADFPARCPLGADVVSIPQWCDCCLK